MKAKNKKSIWKTEFALDGTRILYKNGLPYKSIMPNGRVDYFKYAYEK